MNDDTDTELDLCPHGHTSGEFCPVCDDDGQDAA